MKRTVLLICMVATMFAAACRPTDKVCHLVVPEVNLATPAEEALLDGADYNRNTWSRDGRPFGYSLQEDSRIYNRKPCIYIRPAYIEE
jgi:hypothetical protein